MHAPISKKQPSLTVITALALLSIAGISLYVRIALPYDQVFRDGWVAFKGVDSYYHMRLVDNLLHHFPHYISFDPYTFYPHGNVLIFHPLLDWLIGGTAWLIGLGSPSQHAIDLVGAYLPPILGTLTLIPVYFIGKALFNRWVGLLSAALVVILPGGFLNRSLLGFADHHVAESLFSTVTMLFLILALKSAREREVSFSQLLNRDWGIIARPLIYTLLAGIFLGIYLLAWIGGLALASIIFAYLVIQFIIDHLRSKSTDYLCIIGFPTFLIASIMVSPVLGEAGLKPVYHVSLLIAILAPLALSGISRFMAAKAIKPVYYLLVPVGLAAIGFAVFHAANPSLLYRMLSGLSFFVPTPASLTILEKHPLLLPYGHFSLQMVWLLSSIS